MRQWVWASSLGLTLLWTAGVCRAGDETKTFLDPANWEGLKEFWTIKDGSIVGNAPDKVPFNTFLCSKKKFTDFELSFDIQLLDDKGKSGADSRNSGVQIRSEIFDMKHFAVKGPQCDIGQQYWGSLYGEHFSPDGKLASGMMQAADKAVLAKALKKEGFNHYAIKCVGKHVTIKLNGQTTVDGDFPRMPDSGIIAFQLHSGGGMTATFRNIQFKDLGK